MESQEEDQHVARSERRSAPQGSEGGIIMVIPSLSSIFSGPTMPAHPCTPALKDLGQDNET